MIKRIGTGDSGEPLVLAELNEHERASLSRIVRLAEEHLDDMPFQKVGQRRMLAEMMIDGMRDVFGLDPGPARSQVAPEDRKEA